jgi:hypothetical protein
LRFYGKEKQDRFAYYLIGKQGTFLDIGCYHPTQWNNTKALEEIGWKGLLFDIRDKWVDLCRQHRTSEVFKVDVSTDEFAQILTQNLARPVIDYISLDADDGSLGALQQLLNNGFSFKCMTFEHDYYDRGNALKTPSVALLKAHGYFPLFEDVKLADGKIWEDWWVNPTCFSEDLLQLASKEEFFEDCVYKVMDFNHER